MLCVQQAMTTTTIRQLAVQSTLPSLPARRLDKPTFVCDRSPELFPPVHGLRYTLTALAPGVVRLLSFGDIIAFGTTRKNTWSNI